MKIIVFGATGRVGACVVDQAIQAGHDVTAFVRDRQRFNVDGNYVSVVEGDARNEASVRSALAPGFDATVVAIGERKLKRSNVVTEGVRAIVAGMKACGIGRLLCVSGIAEMPNKTFFGRVTISLLRVTPIGNAIRDHDRAFEEIQRSGLKWMLAGCGHIKDGPRRGGYRTSLVFPGGLKTIHPPDVADFMLRELTEQKFNGNVVGIWY